MKHTTILCGLLFLVCITGRLYKQLTRVALIAHHEKGLQRERFYTGVLYVLGLLTAIFSGFTKAEPDKIQSPLGQAVVALIQDNLGWGIPSLVALSGLVALLKRQLGPTVPLSLTHSILNDMKASIFEGKVASNAEDRVTLFRRLGENLVIVERSGDWTRKSNTRFRVPDNGNAEGVGGQAILKNATLMVENLPNISPDGERNGKKNLAWHVKFREKVGALKCMGWCWRLLWLHRKLTNNEEKACSAYADQTWIAVHRVRKKKICKGSLPRALCAVPVELSGKIWGVIVIDTRSPSLPTQERIEGIIKNHIKMLERIIKFL